MKDKLDKKRLAIYIIFLSLIIIALIGRLVQLMIIIPSKEPITALNFPKVERGSILDRNGRILAISTKLNSVSAWIPNIKDPMGVAKTLAPILHISEKTILEKIEKHSGFVFIKRLVSPSTSEKIEELKAQGKLKGINLTPEYGRNYPEQELASHVIGYVGIDNIGLAGIEYSFNRVLSPQPIGDNSKKIYGDQVFLTIDINVQYIIEKAALKAYKKNKAKDVMILVMDAKTGELLGYASIPNFNPNDYTRAPKDALINRPISFAYEPGSVFKVFSLSSMLQVGAIHSNDHFYCNGFYEKKLKNGKIIKIKCLGVHGDVTPQRIIQYSCNAGAAYASDRINKDTFYQMLLKYGFGRPTGIPLPGETAGILRKPRQWSARSKPTIAIGQEIGVSAIQIVTAATAIANGGVLLKPRIVKKIVSPTGRLIKEYNREPVREVLSPEIATKTLKMMLTATEDMGTARRARIRGIDISAKTGTAQVLDRKTGKYSKNHFISSFLGIFPTEDPRLIVYVVIDYPKFEKYGGRIAAPIFKEIAERLITYEGIPLKNEKVLKEPGEITVKIPKEIKLGDIMPDLHGKPKRVLLSLLADKNYRVILEGSGYVYKQSPAPGTKLKKGMKIILQLR